MVADRCLLSGFKKSVTDLGLLLGDKQKEDIKRLHGYFRNTFAHFSPMGWSIEKAGLPRIIGAGLDAVEALMSMDRMGVRLEESQQARLESTLGAVRRGLEAAK